MIKKPAYWKDIFRDCNLKMEAANDEMTFRKLKEQGILEHRANIEEFSKKCDKKWGMEKKLLDIIEKLKELKLDLFEYKGTYCLRGIDELQ